MILILSAAVPACQTHQTSPVPAMNKIITKIPDDGNCTLKQGPTIYVGDKLFEYIDGAAQSYHDYGFVEVTAGEFELKSNKETVIVDIYDMGNSVNAFGVFSIFRLPQAVYLDIGTECQYSEPTLDMYKDKYYIQLAGARPFPGLKEELARIAAIIDREIKADKKPAQLNLLPDEGRVPHSERYLKQNVLGFLFLKEGWSAEYESAGKKQKLILICLDSKEEAQKGFGRYKNEIKNTSDIPMTSADECISGNDGSNGAFIACRKGKHIIYSSSTDNGTDLKPLMSRQLKKL